MKAYLAGPFFTQEQIQIINSIDAICIKHFIEVFNPKEECVYEKGITDSSDIFSDNIVAIDDSDFIIAVTNGKDVGTLFEAGYAFGIGVPIVYVFLDSEGIKFNIMLAESAHAVCKTYDELEKVLIHYNEVGIQKINNTFKGELQ